MEEQDPKLVGAVVQAPGRVTKAAQGEVPDMHKEQAWVRS